ncbi:SDR family oxidoreductase [Pedobacter immunditicola]|uniref:SDR family oxidoreductase n=1 Tax=Pedobacter immunditicola TaxID=3133440 RepID=UPI0030983B46
MKTILVTGSNGLLGQKITENIRSSQHYRLIATSRGANRFPLQEGYTYVSMDILDPENVRTVIDKYRPDAIIHTAAMTNVDTCQAQQEIAYALNVEAVKTLITCCQTYQIQFIHLSTDFIFDGAAGPYDEQARLNPLSYYGETKAAAEELVKQATCPWVIIRTILVYGIVGDMSRSNIVLWAKGALEKAEPLNVVNDQWRMPTLAEDLAEACLLAVEKEARGIYHISGKDMMSIVELVRKVAAYWNLDDSLVKEVSSATLSQSAGRPLKTGFILDKAVADLNYQPHSFEEGLAILDRQVKALPLK